MKISMVSNIEKVRAPSRIGFHEGLGLLRQRLGFVAKKDDRWPDPDADPCEKQEPVLNPEKTHRGSLQFADGSANVIQRDLVGRLGEGDVLDGLESRDDRGDGNIQLRQVIRGSFEDQGGVTTSHTMTPHSRLQLLHVLQHVRHVRSDARAVSDGFDVPTQLVLLTDQEDTDENRNDERNDQRGLHALLLSRYCLTASSHHDLMSFYPAITGALCQGQQKITISGVSHLLIRMIKKFSFPRMQNRQFIFEPKIQYVLTAERSGCLKLAIS
jgi:hypothetical protein